MRFSSTTKPFTANLYHDGVFVEKPFEYTHGDFKVIDDVDFDGLLYVQMYDIIRRVVSHPDIGENTSMRRRMINHNTRLKNARATYQRLVDSTFQSQIGRNLEAYVDDMVVKSKDEKMLLADIAETFDNLRKINMKLNLKKYSFGVEEGKFLGYMVTSEGIRANPKKTKALADLQSPRTLKEMQSLSGKLAALNRFLAKSVERSLPFFNTLKNITKENKHEYRWTKEAEEAFQQIKKLIMDLPSLTPPWEKETLYAYLAVSAEVVSAVLLTDRKGRQCIVQYVSRMLNEAERNYAPMEKLALSLIHMTR
ncbi:reverse transcriptase domain-containing protein [Tanacetum coccineum]